MTLLQFHAGFAWVVVATNAAVGVWALVGYYRPRWRTGALWRATGVAQATMVVEVCGGVSLVAIEEYEVAPFHTLYGFSGLAAIGIIYSYRDQVRREHLWLLYGLGGLFMMGLALRGLSVSAIPLPPGP